MTSEFVRIRSLDRLAIAEESARRSTFIQTTETLLSRHNYAESTELIQSRRTELLPDVVVRLLQRSYRTQSIPFGQPPSPQVVRSQHPRTEAPAFSPQAAALWSAPASSVKQRQTPVQEPSPIAIDRLTDQVMKQIDRRLLAARERKGRM